MAFLVKRPGHPLEFVMVDHMEPGDIKVNEEKEQEQKHEEEKPRTLSVKKHKRNG